MKLLLGYSFALLLAALAAAPGFAAERPLEKVRIAVSSKSLGFLDTWAAKERGFFRNLYFQQQPYFVQVLKVSAVETLGQGFSHGLLGNNESTQALLHPYQTGIYQ